MTMLIDKLCMTYRQYTRKADLEHGGETVGQDKEGGSHDDSEIEDKCWPGEELFCGLDVLIGDILPLLDNKSLLVLASTCKYFKNIVEVIFPSPNVEAKISKPDDVV